MRIKNTEIPEAATEMVKSTYPDGTKKAADYYLNGEEVGHRIWNEDGQLEYELTLRGGRRHGPERIWHDNGQLMHETFWFNGLEHGLAQQWDEQGHLICSYEMDHGTGMDIWVTRTCGTGPYTLSEERYERDGSLDGYERWWNSDETTVSKESHYKMGEPHGIWREWNLAGKLSRGYPKYFINGKPVTKRQYLAACRNDPTLPRFNPEENKPYRQVSNEIRRRIQRTKKGA